MKLLKLGALAIAGGIVLLAIACGEGATANDNDSGNGAGRDTEVVAAPIDELDILVRESFPAQYAVRIVSGIPSGCHEFKEARITERSGTTITIAVTNTALVGDDIACTQIYGTQESAIELGTDFTSGVEYTVIVNDRTETFVAQ